VKAQAIDLGLRRRAGVLPGSGGVPAGVPPGRAGGTGTRWNGESDERFEDVGRFCLHAGQDMLVEYALAVKDQVKKVFLVHGEALPAMALKGKLAEHGLTEVYYPELHSSVEI